MTEKDERDVCPCTLNPLDSRCGDWEDNRSACVCAAIGLEGRLPS
jgi:hypothetical protein